MIVLILAAGAGRRLIPYSQSCPKPMLSFLGKPAIAHQIDDFLAAGLTTFVIVVNPRGREMLQNYFGQYLPHVKAWFAVQEEPRGTTHAISCARSALIEEDAFLVKYVDSFSCQDQIGPLLDLYRRSGSDTDAAITLRKVENPAPYGIARFEGERLVEIVEKPVSDPPSHLAYVGMSILKSKSFFNAVEGDDFQKEEVPVQPILERGGRVVYWVFEGKRVDLGQPWKILDVTRLLVDQHGGKRESGAISPSARIDSQAYIGPEARIGDRVEIRGYSSVEGEVMDETYIEDSVIMKGARVGRKCHIVKSVIGWNNVIGDGFSTLTHSDSEIMVLTSKGYTRTSLTELGCFTGEGVTIASGVKSYPGKVVYPGQEVTADIVKDIV